MSCCNNTREFLGTKRLPIVIDKSCSIDLSLCTSIRLRLVTNTPVTIDDVNRLTDKDDEYCEKTGSSYPFLNGTKINVVFSDQEQGTSTNMIGVKTVLVPNPKFKECDGCTCK